MKNRPDDHLMSCLAWYLERFLDYPFPPRTEQATNVEDSLEEWGRSTFNTLFGSGLARDWIAEARRAGTFRVQVSSDDSATLSWPWEALYDPEIGVFAHCAQIERRLSIQLPDPPPLSNQLPKDCINILLITSRPYELDVHFRSISRPLIELIENGRLPAHVHLLRPPTVQSLREHLTTRPHTYHIVHFDGHGSYPERMAAFSGAGMSRAQEGQLVFEDDEGNPAPVAISYLGQILHEHAVPMVVLNACKSAMVDSRARDPFASVAAALLRSGVRSVVAMAYSLYVRSAQEFLPTFYETLVETGSVSEATRKGRIRLQAQPYRNAIAPRIPLKDWLVPVVYQQEKFELPFAASAKPTQGSTEKLLELPEEARIKGRYTFTGRDGALLKLERAMRCKPAGILIHGLAGVGKTTLVKAFVHWLSVTGGLGHRCFWFTFDNIRSVAHVFNEMGRAIWGPQFGSDTITTSFDQLVQVFRERPFFIVWDNFESVRGVPETDIAPMLSSGDQILLRRFLEELQGGLTKILLTSRTREDWLSPQNCSYLRLGGLRHEELWNFAAQILDSLSIELNRQDGGFIELLDGLGGNPIVLQAVLSQLEKSTVAEVRVALANSLKDFAKIDDDLERCLYASLNLIRRSLSQELTPLLIPLALHERFVDAIYLETMSANVNGSLDRGRIDRFTSTLVASGLLTEVGSFIYEIHPLMPSYLRAELLPEAAVNEVQSWTSAFVDVMGQMADLAKNTELQEQRARFALHQANFHAALAHAERLHMYKCFAALSQALGSYAIDTRNFAVAQQFIVRLAERAHKEEDEDVVAGSYHTLGVIADQEGNFAQAREWYSKALEIDERTGDEFYTFQTCYELGRLAEKQEDFAEAEKWEFRALEIAKKLGRAELQAMTYQGLGSIALSQYHLAEAQEWLLRSFKINERLCDESATANNFEGLGCVARSRRDFRSAEAYYLASLEINERLGKERSLSNCYQALGMIADERRDFAAAERWYLKAVAIDERLDDKHAIIRTYYRLGVSTQAQRDFAVAEKWYLKALELSKAVGAEETEAAICHQLGIIAFDRSDYAVAEKLSLRALELSEKFGNTLEAAANYNELGLIADEKGDFAAAAKFYRQSLEMFERLGNVHAAAHTYSNLANTAARRERFVEAVRWLAKAMAGFIRTKDPVSAQKVARKFLAVLGRAPLKIRGKLRSRWKKARLGSSATSD